MSGINTLVDTLMHQVLGKRVDTPSPRVLNEPVRPATSMDPQNPVRSDSRLNHSEQRVDGRVGPSGRALRELPTGPAVGRQAGLERGPPSSTQTSFSQSARSIADLFIRFPSSLSAVRIAQPLLQTSAPSASPQVAESLQHSVRDSGLFYESHLARWFRGELSKEQLLREPQMTLPLLANQGAQSAQPGLRSSLPAFLLGLSRAAGPPGSGNALPTALAPAASAVPPSGQELIRPISVSLAPATQTQAPLRANLPSFLLGVSRGGELGLVRADAGLSGTSGAMVTTSGVQLLGAAAGVLSPPAGALVQQITLTSVAPEVPQSPLRSNLPAFLLGLSRDGALVLARPQAAGAGAGPAGAGMGLQPGAGLGMGASAPAGAQTGAPASLTANLAANAQGAERMAAPLDQALAAGALRPDPRQPIHESLQGLVRHQLEMLATPVLRWEGDVWSGIFMSLLIQPPQQRPGEQGERQQAEEGRDSGDEAWHSSLILEVNGLGQVGVKLWLTEQRLELELAAGVPEVRQALAAGLDGLRARLEALDLPEVQIRLRDQRSTPELTDESQAA